MESNSLRYFCITFCHLGWAFLFVFNNKKPKGYILVTVNQFRTKSKKAEGSASGSALTPKISQHGDRRDVNE